MSSVEAQTSSELTAKQSVEAAKQFARDVLSEEEFLYPRLEAVELSNDGEYWLVTISYLTRQKDPDVAGLADFLRGGRAYKTIHVRRSDGKVLKMTPANRL